MDTNLPEHTLADVVPTLLAALGLPGFTNHLGVDDATAAGVLVIDGLGWELLDEYAEHAPLLAALAIDAEPLTAGFPATTATSVASLGTGLRAGQHGIVGSAFAIPGAPPIDALRWTGIPDREDLRDLLVPEEVQPEPTMPELAAAAGVHVTVATPAYHQGSGLTRAITRGGRFHPLHAFGDLTATMLDALTGPRPAYCYAYHGDLDALGHRYGPGSPAWRYQLGQIDRMVEDITTGLPPGSVLAVVADHGMVRLTAEEVVDADTEPALHPGVRTVIGDIRARHVYAEPGAAGEVLAAWRDVIGSRAEVLGRDEAIARGWFGPVVTDRVRPRIGDVVVAARGGSGVIRTEAEPRQSVMIGHHGSLSTAEQLVPFLVFRG